MNKFEIYNTDGIKFMRNLAKNGKKVSHIITDPPYNISQQNNFSTMKHRRKGVDFGEWDKEFDLFGWINLASLILDKNGSIITFCSYKFVSFIAKEYEKNGICVKDILVWQKSNPMPRNVNRRYVQDMEFALWGVKNGAKWVFNKPDNKPYLRSIFQTPVVAGKEKRAHPTQKSLNLMSEIIQIHTNEKDLVLDPFMGSGTTGVACANLKRNFIGVEIDKDYFKIARDRLKEFLC